MGRNSSEGFLIAQNELWNHKIENGTVKKSNSSAKCDFGPKFAHSQAKICTQQRHAKGKTRHIKLTWPIFSSEILLSSFGLIFCMGVEKNERKYGERGGTHFGSRNDHFLLF